MANDKPDKPTKSIKSTKSHISAKNFVKKLKVEVKAELAEKKKIIIESNKTAKIKKSEKRIKMELENNRVPDSVFKAFEMMATPIDLEENYRKLWKKTYKRS